MLPQHTHVNVLLACFRIPLFFSCCLFYFVQRVHQQGFRISSPCTSCCCYCFGPLLLCSNKCFYVIGSCDLRIMYYLSHTTCTTCCCACIVSAPHRLCYVRKGVYLHVLEGLHAFSLNRGNYVFNVFDGCTCVFNLVLGCLCVCVARFVFRGTDMLCVCSDNLLWAQD